MRRSRAWRSPPSASSPPTPSGACSRLRGPRQGGGLGRRQPDAALPRGLRHLPSLAVARPSRRDAAGGVRAGRRGSPRPRSSPRSTPTTRTRSSSAAAIGAGEHQRRLRVSSCRRWSGSTCCLETRDAVVAARALPSPRPGSSSSRRVLPQSRGSPFVFPVVVLLYLALVPNCSPLPASAPVCLATLLVRGSLLDVYSAARGDTLPDAFGALEEFSPIGSAAAFFAGHDLRARRPVCAAAARPRQGRWCLGLRPGWPRSSPQSFCWSRTATPSRRPRTPGTSFLSRARSSRRARRTSAPTSEQPLRLLARRHGRVPGLAGGRDRRRKFRHAVPPRASVDEPLYPHSLPVMVPS